MAKCLGFLSFKMGGGGGGGGGGRISFYWELGKKEATKHDIKDDKFLNESFYNMRCLVIFITAVCLIFFLRKVTEILNSFLS